MNIEELQEKMKEASKKLRPISAKHWSVAANTRDHCKVMSASWKKLAKAQGLMLDQQQQLIDRLLQDLEAQCNPPVLMASDEEDKQ